MLPSFLGDPFATLSCGVVIRIGFCLTLFQLEAALFDCSGPNSFQDCIPSVFKVPGGHW